MSVWTFVDLRVQMSFPVAPWALHYSSGTHLKSYGSPCDEIYCFILVNYLFIEKNVCYLFTFISSKIQFTVANKVT